MVKLRKAASLWVEIVCSSAGLFVGDCVAHNKKRVRTFDITMYQNRTTLVLHCPGSSQMLAHIRASKLEVSNLETWNLKVGTAPEQDRAINSEIDTFGV